MLALRSLFDAEAAGELTATYGLRIGENRFRVEIADGELEVGRGAAEDSAATIAIVDAPTFAAILAGQLPLDEAVAAGGAQVEGSKQSRKALPASLPDARAMRVRRGRAGGGRRVAALDGDLVSGQGRVYVFQQRDDLGGGSLELRLCLAWLCLDPRQNFFQQVDFQRLTPAALASPSASSTLSANRGG